MLLIESCCIKSCKNVLNLFRKDVPGWWKNEMNKEKELIRWRTNYIKIIDNRQSNYLFLW
jgi:hypothetical protein